MSTIMVSTGRQLSARDIDFIQHLIQDNPGWTRTRLSRELCKLWDWYAPNGRPKDRVCRTFLRKLHERNLVTLPTPLHSRYNQFHNRNIPDILHCTDEIREPLKRLVPLRIVNARDNTHDLNLFKFLLHNYHYLGYKGCPGESMPYMVFDQKQRPVAALLFAAAAWKIAPRDNFIGWDPSTRKRNLVYLTNNVRFLILPWVQVKNLASYILCHVAKHLNYHWTRRYQHPLYLMVHPIVPLTG